ncbi:MAG: ankyrin repeat domain-containing protein [Silvibacterium sp.]
MIATIALAARMVWEETFLTLREGPQMVGFTLAHGVGAILFLAPLLLCIWLLIALVATVISLCHKRPLSTWYWSTLASAILTLGFLSLPASFWQWMFIGTFATSPHAADLMVYEAAAGDVRTVRRYLDHGVPLTARNYEGSTAAFTAAAGGSLLMVEMLFSKGIDLNATNSYGDSPLEAATENGHIEVAGFLKRHGAIQIRGTEEQRSAAAHAIVSKAMQRE